MHEWALAEAVVSTVLKIAERERWRKVFEVRIQVGELQQIDREIFDFALSRLRTPRGYPLIPEMSEVWQS
jgi:hydrogenase nickel incorporation protein HypA/HybF